MSCGKVPYQTRSEAKAFIKLHNKIYRNDTKLTNTYYCEECSNYHTTSMDKVRGRKKRFYMDNKNQ